MCCASCGQAEIDDIKLKMCGGCNLVNYCSDDCQENHMEEHSGECKKRKAELRDRDLFTQPDESHWGECPICCLPLPINVSSMFMPCCSKRICNGCDIANQKREVEEGLEHRCPYCREPAPKSERKAIKSIMNRVKKNVPAAMCHMGKKHYGEWSYEKALEYLTKAAELGDAEAHYILSIMYQLGLGVDKDAEKEIYHSEEAAIAGHPQARFNLGCEEANNGRFERARKHFIIAANLGYQDSLNDLRKLYADGHATKEDYFNALRAYQAAVDATKSSDRDKAEEAVKSGKVKTF